MGGARLPGLCLRCGVLSIVGHSGADSQVLNHDKRVFSTHALSVSPQGRRSNSSPFRNECLLNVQVTKDMQSTSTLRPLVHPSLPIIANTMFFFHRWHYGSADRSGELRLPGRAHDRDGLPHP